jgi:hypothetical protein
MHKYHKLYVKVALVDAGTAATNFVRVSMFVISKGLDYGLLGCDTK